MKHPNAAPHTLFSGQFRLRSFFVCFVALLLAVFTLSQTGERVVKAALAAGFRVEAIPGACALITALTASGLPTDEFHFIGFLPHKSGQRRKQLERLKSFSGTLILYESPYRIEKALTELNEIFPERTVVLARELTKKFEEFLRGTAGELLGVLKKRSLKGEFVILISGEAPVDRATST